MASGLEKRAMLPVMLAVEIRDQSIRRKPIARGRLTIGAKRKVGGEKQQCYEQDWLGGFHTYFPSQGFHGKAVMLPEIKNCVRYFLVFSSCALSIVPSTSLLKSLKEKSAILSVRFSK